MVVKPEVTFLETDIDCPFCMEKVRSALIRVPGVEAVEEDVAAGCLVVTHRTTSEYLMTVVTDIGHHLGQAGNGEPTMEQAHVADTGLCASGLHRLTPGTRRAR